ncbi:MAG: type II toxin-antitoxin system PemK/MazF family toxin [Rhodospirillaceae bacterium]|nr:type II toxin-antitoxin system PemK/MazF family toxin [Rhodospirillaceae bacterium]
MDLKRGQIVIVVASGDFGKPRPAVIVQSDILNKDHETISVCLLTSDLRGEQTFRVNVEPTPANGLNIKSQVMTDKIMTLSRKRLRKIVGLIAAETMAEIDLALRWTLSLA